MAESLLNWDTTRRGGMPQILARDGAFETMAVPLQKNHNYRPGCIVHNRPSMGLRWRIFGRDEASEAGGLATVRFGIIVERVELYPITDDGIPVLAVAYIVGEFLEEACFSVSADEPGTINTYRLLFPGQRDPTKIALLKQGINLVSGAYQDSPVSL